MIDDECIHFGVRPRVHERDACYRLSEACFGGVERCEAPSHGTGLVCVNDADGVPG